VPERFDGLRQVRWARTAGDCDAMMRTGFVIRKLRSIGSGKDAQIMEEYKIDPPLVEAMNSVERRAAIEPGQEQDNVNVTGRSPRMPLLSRR
jgi:hypothetical protein